MIDTIGVWIASLLTLCILSFLYKDNPFYKFAEHLFIGVSAAYWAAYYYHNILLPNLVQPLFRQGELLFIIPLALGIMMLAFSAEAAMSDSWWIAAPIAVFGSTLFSCLELFVAFLQAYIFTFLSALFIGAAVHHH